MISSTDSLGSQNNPTKPNENTGARRAWVKPELQQLSIRQALMGCNGGMPDSTNSNS